MDPFSVSVVTALAAGAVAVAKDVATKAVKDAYSGLRQLIVDRYKKTAPFVEAVEANPTSTPEQEVLANQLQQATGDPQLKELASALLRALDELHNDPRAKAVFDFGKLKAAKNFELSDIDFSGTLLRAEEATFDGDFKSTNLRQKTEKVQAEREAEAEAQAEASRARAESSEPSRMRSSAGEELGRDPISGSLSSAPPASQRRELHEPPPGYVPPPPPQPRPDNASLVRVYYATDRLKIHDWSDGPQYNFERSQLGKLQYGECTISIPKIHKMGKLESPSLLKLEFRPNPEKHIVLTYTKSLEEEAYFEHVRASIAKSAKKEAFVFVHGYNVSFEDAARRTGQIAFDLGFIGAPIFYSWPSNDKVADYIKDETNITWSTPHFQRFLTLLSQNSGAKRIHIIAHSMGNRAVCDALKALSYDPSNSVKFNHLVLAAPDIDAETFQELAATLQGLAARVTLYESSKDKALFASKTIHGNARAGEPLLIIPGLDTIDASLIDTDFLGHSYFSESWPLLSDIHSLLFNDEPASQRFGLTKIDSKDGKYYAFRE
jgi:esterase/lipase superfamily enzyme